jgi:hypothetical protein
VPQEHPGLMVWKKLQLKPGGNKVLSYLDIIAQDAWWKQAFPSESTSTAWWRQSLGPVGELIAGKNVPWTVQAGEVYLIFNSSASVPRVPEYEKLLGVALGLWEEWRERSGLR